MSSASSIQAIRQELQQVIIGQDEVINELLITLCAGGHALLEGVPGLAKSLLVSSLAQSTGCSFNRIQFTPDLMPSDITGTEVIRENKETGDRDLVFLPGPIFSSIILADEINRTPPKTQAALLEAMQERHVSIGGEQRKMAEPFFVLATQNPLEQEGTYPLPEAQLDRFLMKIVVNYPKLDDELSVIMQTTGSKKTELQSVISPEELCSIQNDVREIEVATEVARYALELTRATRPNTEDQPQELQGLIRWGAGPRAGQALLLCAKARCYIEQRQTVTIEDISAVAPAVLRHRIQPTYEVQAKQLSSDDLINTIISIVKPGGSALGNDPVLQSFKA